MKTRTKILLALVLIALPILGRWLWFNRGQYQPPVIAEIGSSQISPVIPEYEPAVDEPVQGDGRVVIDLSHENNLQLNDLAPLRNRLLARGIDVQTLEADSADSLETLLRGAATLVVIAPTTSYTDQEREVIVDFVEDGGRLFLAADPTRPVPVPPEEMTLSNIFFPTSATPAINSLAHAFGVVYFDDYLYNLEENEGNYRNVKFTTFSQESPLTQGLEEVVFFASHSLRSDGQILIWGDEDTLSPSRGNETNLGAAALAANERVLALGDMTFLTPPYHMVADNDRLLNHIADWLAGATRQRDLEDFPYLFNGPVDLVQVTGDVLDPRLVAGTSRLQDAFEEADLELTLRASPRPEHDALLLGTFDDTDLVKEYLTTAGVTITLTMTGTQQITGSTPLLVPPSVEETPAAAVSPTVEPTPILTPLLSTDAGEADQQEAQMAGDQETPEPAPASPEAAGEAGIEGIIQVEELGALQIEGTSLFLVDRSDDRISVIALAEDGQALATAVEKLISGDLSGCVERNPVTVCSTGQVQASSGGEESSASASQDISGPRIFILADDDGPEGQRTGVDDLETILGAVYTVTVWSTSRDGIPTGVDVAGYDAYIIDSGDYAYDLEDSDTLAAFTEVQGSSAMFIGEQPLPLFAPEPVAINDLAVADVTHPIAFGFNADQVITLLPSESGIPAIVIPDSPESFGEGEIIFSRGPNSAETGQPAVLAAVNEQTGGHVILAGFAFYRLPDDVQRDFALNAVKWLLEK